MMPIINNLAEDGVVSQESPLLPKDNDVGFASVRSIGLVIVLADRHNNNITVEHAFCIVTVLTVKQNTSYTLVFVRHVHFCKKNDRGLHFHFASACAS